jgi:hypothetical protein
VISRCKRWLRFLFFFTASISDVLDNADQLSVSSDVTEQPQPSWDDKDGCVTEDDDNEQLKKPVLRFILFDIDYLCIKHCCILYPLQNSSETNPSFCFGLVTVGIDIFVFAGSLVTYSCSSLYSLCTQLLRKYKTASCHNNEEKFLATSMSCFMMLTNVDWWHSNGVFENQVQVAPLSFCNNKLWLMTVNFGVMLDAVAQPFVVLLIGRSKKVTTWIQGNSYWY